MRVLITSLTLAALVCASAAHASEKDPVITVIDVRPQGSVTSDQAQVARGALERGFSEYRVHVVTDHAAILAAHGAGAEAAIQPAIAQARAHVEAGKKLLGELDAIGAEKELRLAADLFEGSAGALANAGDLVNTYLQLARVFFGSNREVVARDIFKRVVQLQPDLALDKAVFPPGMVTIFEDVKKSTLAGPLGSLTIASNPTPAKVYLDGRERGTTPLDLVNIVVGVHKLVVRRPGYAPFVRPVDVTSFRVDKIAAELALDRHPALEQAFIPKAAETKDGLGLTLNDYLDSVASTAGIDILYVGRLSRSAGSNVLEVRGYRASTHVWEASQKFPFAGKPPESFDGAAKSLLTEAANDGWVPPLASRHNLAAGGGALDETARFDFRIALAPGARIAGKGTNFPRAVQEGFRATIDYRLGPRLMLTGETGLDVMSESNVVLTDSAGNIVAPGAAKIQSVYTSIPLDIGARYYLGVGTLAPYAVGGLGLRYDQLQFRESLAFDKIKGSSGLGLDAYAGGGADYALGLRSALFGEVRFHTGTVGVGNAILHTSANPPTPDRTLPVKAGLFTGIRIYAGYLHIF